MKITILISIVATGSLWAQQTVTVVSGSPATAPAGSFTFTRAFTGPVGMEARVAPIKGMPYSADVVTESVQVLADGNRIVSRNTAFVARDSRGRTRNETSIQRIGSASSESGLKMIMLHDPVALVTYTLDSNSKTAHKVSMGPRAEREAALKDAVQDKINSRVASGTVVMEGQGSVSGTYAVAADLKHAAEQKQLVEAGQTVRMRTGGSANLKSESLGRQMIEGVMADGTRTTETIPAGQIGNERELQIVNEVWVAEDLKAVVLSKRTDPRSGEMTYKLTSIQRSEPAPALFEVPSDYTVLDTVLDAPSRENFIYKAKE